MEFEEFPKIARLSRECVITEKIDGTNAQVHILKADGLDPLDVGRVALAVMPELGLVMLAGSRTQYITPERDNHGFARWAQEHAGHLWGLGEGRHFGEWWGSGIQRGYGLQKGEKRFSLFNVARWADDRDREKFSEERPACCGVVPVLYRGEFTSNAATDAVSDLVVRGSHAAPGFTNPEGIVLWHEAARLMFKKTIDRDSEPKSRHVPARAVERPPADPAVVATATK